MLDVIDADACRRTVDDVVERHGRLDVVIAGAGIGVAGDAHEIPLASWRASVEVNLMGNRPSRLSVSDVLMSSFKASRCPALLNRPCTVPRLLAGVSAATV